MRSKDMPTHQWRLSPASALDSVLAHAGADDETTARRQALDAAADLIRAGHTAPFAVLIDDAPVTYLAPARTEDGVANIDESLAVLAGVRDDLQGSDR
jgi:hypothetical protein